ncbi:hypothetical protein K502DRAFT_242898 [Neoconidiobolus thromboides FSU 785]|nr:hypothetical protein K502DRAFT_242898 [Neoconidiobolus thromboides FSU 785]
MEGDKEQLLLMKQKEHHELERHEIQLNQLKNEQTKFNETIQSTRDKLSSLKSEQGKLQAIVENHNKIYEEKNLLLEKIKQNFANDELFDNNQVFDDDDQYTKFIIECLKNSLRNTNAEFKSNKESIRNKETQINQSLTELSSKLIKSKSDIISFNNSLKKIDLKMSDLHKEITTFDKEEAEVDTIKQKIETKKREIEVIKKEINEKKYTDLISEKNTKLMELEKELFTLSSQTVANNSTMENQIQIQILKIQRLNIEEQIKMIIEIYGQQFERVLNHMPLPRNAQRQVELAKSVKQDELKDTNTKLERYQKNQITAETKLTIYKTIMEEKKVKVNEYSKQCRMLCENASFPLVLQSIESELEELKRNVNELKGEDSAIRNHFSGFDNSEISTDNCPTCQQDIDPKIKKKLNLEYPNHLPKIRQLEKEIMNKELKLRELREFYPNFKLMKKIQNQEISELENELVINEANGKHFKNEYNKLKVIYETQLRDLEILLELSFVSKELEKADKLKDSLDIKLRRSNNNTINASPNSANEVNEDLPKLINELRNGIHQLKEELKEKEKKLIELEKEIQKFKEKLFHIHNKSQKKEENQKEIINLKKEKENLLKLIKESEKEKLEFEPQVEEKRKNINLIHEELDALDKMNQKKILKYQRYLNQLSQIQVTLDKSNILQRTEEQKLNQREQEENKSIIDEIQLKLQKVENEMEKIKNKINSTTSFERDIMDNINYLELNEKITELKKELITYNNLVNINEIAHLNRQLDQLKADSKNYENKKARLGGEVKMLKTQNLKIDAEIQSSYKNAHKEHQQQMVKCCINELTVKDLELYSKALDT